MASRTHNGYMIDSVKHDMHFGLFLAGNSGAIARSCSYDNNPHAVRFGVGYPPLPADYPVERVSEMARLYSSIVKSIVRDIILTVTHEKNSLQGATSENPFKIHFVPTKDGLLLFDLIPPVK